MNTTVITGACSGLGYAVAQYLVSQGQHVCIFDLDDAKGTSVVQELGANNARFFHVDVTQEQDINNALAAINQAQLTIRCLVNCAGIAPAKRLLDKNSSAMPLSDFSRVIDINLIGTFNCCRLVAQSMAQNELDDNNAERGVIINTASVAGYEGQIGQSAYAASKAGIIGLCLPMARDLATLGIRVNTIAPGVMGTPLLLAMPQKVQDALSANIPFPPRLGAPQEFAKLVAHIQSNGYLNGETIRLDGALRMPPK